MKPKLISLSGIAAATIAASGIFVIETARAFTNGAQPYSRDIPGPGQAYTRNIILAQTDTAIGSNPYLRSKSAPTPPSTIVKMSQKDVNFIQKAAGGGQQEVENGKLAEKQGKSADVKRIGARMVADHTASNKELTALANKKGVNFNTKGVKAQDLGTADFDRTYLNLLEVNHKSDIADFEKEAKSGDDRDLKSWAAKMLPRLKEHLAMVQDALKK
jgi:putative membrane protein